MSIAAVEIHASDDGGDNCHAYDSVGGSLFNYTDSGGNMTHPIDIALASDDSIWVSNYGTGSGRAGLYHFDSVGTYLGIGGITGHGGSNGQFSSAGGICISSDGSIFVGDVGNNRVQKFDSTGTYVAQWGSLGATDGLFNFGSASAYLGCLNDEIYVSDYTNKRIQVFDTSGTFQRKWGSNGTGNGQFSAPRGISFDAANQVYVVESSWTAPTGRGRVQWFTTTGMYVGEYDPPSDSTANGDFNQPLDIAVDAGGFIYIADAGNNRIQKFTSAFVYSAKWTSNFPEGVSARGGASVFVPQIYRRR